MSQTLRYLFSFRPTGLPPLAWTPVLLILVALAVAGQFADGVLSYILLAMPDRLIVEANPVMAILFSDHGLAGMLLGKLLCSVLIIFFVDILRRRGFFIATYGLTIVAVLLGAAVTANGIILLLI